METGERRDGLGPAVAEERARMRAVALAGARLAAVPSLEVFDAVLREACNLVLTYDDLSVGLYDAATHTIRFGGGFDQGIYVPPMTVSAAGRPAERVMRERRTLVTLSSDDPAGHGAVVHGTGRRSESVIRTPILAGERVLGIMSLHSYTPGLYGDDDVEVFETLAAVAAPALLNLEHVERLERAAEALREREHFFRTLIEGGAEMISVLDREGRVRFGSGPATPDSPPPLGRSAFDNVHEEDMPRVRQLFEEISQTPGATCRVVVRVRRGDRLRSLEVHATNLLDRAPVHGVLVNARDVTEREALEHRLQHAQKMEAVGQLAGGVAHDFNNLLTAIGGNLAFALEALPPAHPARVELDEISRAAERARTLVRQLLTFSRRDPVQPRRVRPSELLAGTERLLRRLVGEEIDVALHVSDHAMEVVADPGQLEQVLVNLAVNARDAMLTPRHGHPGRGGRLDIELAEIALTHADVVAWQELSPGRYARLRVRDVGHGMDADTQSRAFEPFFTTKPPGEGTGLGLATVFGIVRRSGGAVRVESEPGRGTIMTVLWPVAAGAAPAATAPGGPTAAEAPLAGVTVLLVEDEAPVRAMERRLLERRGAVVHEARHGVDGLRVWREHAPTIDVLVTDLRMPEMGGRELADQLLAEDAALPIVFVSGYSTEGASVAVGPLQVFVEKPFPADGLVAAVARVVAEARRVR